MRHETAPSYEYNHQPEQQITLDNPLQPEAPKPLNERPLSALGDLVLFATWGGALGTMSHLEELVLETTVAVVETGDRLAA